MKSREIPNYYVYGEPVRNLDAGFVHVELVSTRNSVHRGEVAAHMHPQLTQITFWLKGGGTYRIEDKSWIFSAPAVSFVPSGVVHGFSIADQSDAVVLSISDDALKTVVGEFHSSASTMFVHKVENKNDWVELRRSMTLLLREYEEQKPFAENSIMHLAGLCYCFISRLHVATGERQITHAQNLAQRLRKLIDLHFRDNWTIPRYVSALGTTQYLLEKAANLNFARPVKAIILERRLLEAKRLLKFTIRSAEDIAAELGFKDPAYFSREFKKHTSVAPGHWRRDRRLER